jgi:uncharacterized repeat protein (TIGR01451 family)
VDLAIVKTPSGSTTPGSTWSFSMSVRNNGPSDAESPVVVVDTLPAGMTYLSNGPDWYCLPFDQEVFCILQDADGAYLGLAADQDAPPLLLGVRIADQPSTATYVNEAEVFTDNEDTNPNNNISRATVTVAPTPQPPTPVDPDPEKPVDPQVPVDPGKPLDPEKPVDPGKPPVIPQRPTKPLPLPETIKPGRPTVVLPGGIVTNAKQPVTATVTCRPLRESVAKSALTFSGQWVPMGQVSYCKVTRKKNGKVTVTVTYPGPVLVKVVYSAPKVPGYTAFKQVKRYVVVPR